MSRSGPGRPPLPEEIKIARGTNRPGRAKVSPSIPMTDKPDPPETLGEIGRAVWIDSVDQMQAHNMLERRYMAALLMLCEAYDRKAHYEAACKGKEFTTVESGYVCAHPAIGLAKQARDEIRRYQTEFGFTPSSATGIGSPPQKTKGGVPSRRVDIG